MKKRYLYALVLSATCMQSAFAMLHLKNASDTKAYFGFDTLRKAGIYQDFQEFTVLPGEKKEISAGLVPSFKKAVVFTNQSIKMKRKAAKCTYAIAHDPAEEVITLTFNGTEILTQLD